MNRTIAAWSSIAFFLSIASTAVKAQSVSKDHLRIVLSGQSESYEYSIDPMTLEPSLNVRCEKQQANTCSIYSQVEFQSDQAAKVNEEKRVRSELKLQSQYDHIAVDATGTIALIGGNSAFKTEHQFQVFNLAAHTSVQKGTTQRRIEDVEWVGTRGCFALLTSTYSVGLAPWHWPLIFAGHPPQYDTYYLEVYAPDGYLLHDVVVQKDLRSFYASLWRRRAIEVLDGTLLQLHSPC